MPRHKKGSSDNTGAYALAGVGSLLLLAAIASGSKKNAANGDDAKKQVQTEPGTPSALAEKAKELVDRYGKDGVITTEQIKNAFGGAEMPYVVQQTLTQNPNATFTPETLVSNFTAHGVKGTSGANTTNTPLGDKGNASPNVTVTHHGHTVTGGSI